MALFGPTVSLLTRNKPLKGATSNIIQALRVQDPLVYRREVWEDDEGPVEEQENTAVGGVVANSDTALLRFGTPLEITIHHSMRMLAVTDLLMVPFIASFDAVYPLRDQLSMIMLDCTVTFLYVCGVALRLRTSYVDASGMEGKSSARIMRTVLNSKSFWADIVALIFSPLLHMRGPWGYLCLLRMLKSWRIPPKAHRVMLLSEPDSQVGLLLLDVLVGFFLCEHLYACAWFWAKVNSPPGDGREWSIWNGWAADAMDSAEEKAMAITSGISSAQLGYFYLYALRDGGFMLAGWGGVETLSVPELVLISFLAPVSACLVAFAAGLFVSAVGAAMIKQEEYLVKSASLNSACIDLELPDELRHRISRYQSYVHIHSMDSGARELIEDLSDNLLGEVRVHRMRKVIEEATFFHDMSARQVLQVLGMMVEKVYAPGDLICLKGEPADSMSVIARGSVGVFTSEDSTDCFRHMYAGDMLGHTAFMQTDAKRTAYVRAENFTVLMKLERDTFLKYLDTDKTLKVKFGQTVRDDVRRFSHPLIAPDASILNVGLLRSESPGEEDEEENETTPLISERPLPPLTAGENKEPTNLGQPFYPNLENLQKGSAPSMAPISPRGDLKSSGRSSSRGTKSVPYRSEEDSGEQQITFQRLYGQLLEFRAESRSRGEALEHQMEELRCSLKRVTSVLDCPPDLQGARGASQLACDNMFIRSRSAMVNSELELSNGVARSTGAGSGTVEAGVLTPPRVCEKVVGFE